MRDKSVTSWFEMYNSFRRRHFPHILFPSSDQHVRNELGLVEQLFIIVSKTASAKEPQKTYLEATIVNPMGRPFIPANPGIEIAGTWSPDHIPPPNSDCIGIMLVGGYVKRRGRNDSIILLWSNLGRSTARSSRILATSLVGIPCLT
jgi:hypothetical protein